MVLRETARPRNYLAVARMLRVCPDFGDAARRYLLGAGDYPYECRLRTPLGIVAPTLHSRHDMFTVNEVFCRRDYPVPPGARSVVDIGSNIGLSALFFLTRDESCRCWLYEPVPANVERLRANLRAFADRFELREVAVAAADGRASFGVEDSGRYGGIGVATGRSIDVECVAVNDVLEEALDALPVVDLLKIDTEGSELEILRAIRPDLLARVRTICLETDTRPSFTPHGFRASFRNETWVLRSNARSH